MQALNKKVIVEAIKTEEKSDKGIIVDTKKLADKGVVVSIGPDVTDKIAKGDTIYFHEYAGKKVVIEGKEFILLNQDEMYCKL